MTNLDRIRSMSAEELAVWLADVVNCADCPMYEECPETEDSCYPNQKHWLDQEATNEKV